MPEDIKQKLEVEIVRLQEKLAGLSPESEEYRQVLKALESLHEMKLDDLKVELDFDEKREKRIFDNGRADEDLRVREHELELKLAQVEDQKKDRWIKIGVAGAELVVPLIFYGIWYRTGLKFETEGTITSSFFRNLVGKMTFKKK